MFGSSTELITKGKLATVNLCSEMHANEIHKLYIRHHKVSPNINSH